MTKGRIFDIQRGSLVDGDGVRTAVFFKGCSLRCKWCHNPEGISRDTQLLVYSDRCRSCGICKSVCPSPSDCILCGKCADYCPNGARELCGREYTEKELFSIIEKDRGLYNSTGGGVTFSGGECMLQIDFLEKMLTLCNENSINTAVDTAGNVPLEHFLKIAPLVNTFLYDVKCASEDLHIEGTGVSNKQILSNLRSLSDNGARIYIRIPIIVGFNDTLSEQNKIKELLKGINCEKIELLPYHEMGVRKCVAAGVREYSFSSPDKEKMKELNLLYKEIIKK